MIKIIHRYFRGRWERYYFKNHWHLVLDLSLLMTVFILLAALFYLYFYRPSLPGFGGFSRPKVDLNNPPLGITFSIPDKSITDNSEVDLAIKLKNDGTVAIKDISFSLLPLSKEFSIEKIEELPGETDSSVIGKKLSISVIPAHSSGTVAVKIKMDRLEKTARTIRWQAVTEYLLNNQVFRQTDNLPDIHLVAEIETKAGAYYTSPQGDQLGIGPIPPIIGIPTKYWIFWEVEGSDNLKNISLSARLPRYIELSEQRSLLSGKFNYNSDTRQIIWNIDELKLTEGPTRLNFELQLTPTEDQLGKSPLLLEAGKYFATDILTGMELSGDLPALTTELESDRFNSGRGEVVAQ